MFMDTNLDDTGLFPNLARLERETVLMLSKILGSPRGYGYIVTGGTEANITGIWIARNRYLKNVKGRPEIIVPKTAHFSFLKAADMLDLKLIRADITEEFTVDVVDVEEKISNNTVAIVGIAGTTELGTIDPISELSEIAVEKNVHLHVDAAFGGLFISIMRLIGYNYPNIGFENPGVSTITIDPHKLGFVPIPSGGIIARSRELFKHISVKAPYLLSEDHETIVGSRTGGSIAATWVMLKYLGIEGYGEIFKELLELKNYLVKRLEEIKSIEIPYVPMLPIVSFKHEKIKSSKLRDKLMEKGWILYLAPMINGLRIIVMPHLNKKVIDKFAEDLENSIKEIEN